MQPIKWFLFTSFKIGIKPIKVPIIIINNPLKFEIKKTNNIVRIKKKIFNLFSFIFPKYLINFFANKIAINVEIVETINANNKEYVKFSNVNLGIICFKVSIEPFLDLFIVYKVIKESRILKVVREPVRIKDSSEENFVIVEAIDADCDGPNAGRNVEKKDNIKDKGITFKIFNFVIFGCVISWEIILVSALRFVNIEGIANKPDNKGSRGSFKV